jgi:hypothetical protein
MKTWGSGVIAPPFLTSALGGSGHLHAPAVHARGYSSRYALDRRLSGPQSRYGRCGEVSCPCRESNPGKQDQNICDDGILVKVLWFWTLSFVLSLSIGPNLQVLPEVGNRIHSPKRCVLKDKQDNVLDKGRMMDNVQKHNIFTGIFVSNPTRGMDICVYTVFAVLCRYRPCDIEVVAVVVVVVRKPNDTLLFWG